jgi:polysaccharide deacetylase 2 family uncharacterized protein YibQ
MTSLLLLLASLSFAQTPAASPAPDKPKLAVVIDDFGLTYPKDQPDEDWMALKFPMTFAVMPVSPRTAKMAQRTKESGHELIIHFPFDKYLSLKLPKDAVDPEDLKKVDALLAKAFAQIPDAKGLNNHQSYRGTMNRPMMEAFMKRVKGKVGFFLDSRVSSKSVAYEEAKKAGIPAAMNGIFLDGTAETKNRRKGGAALEAGIEQDKALCEHYLRIAANSAKKHGHAVAIGHHYYHGTYRCLVEELPKIQKDGVELVFASAIAN